MFSLNVYGDLSLKLKNPDFVKIICKYDVVFLSECWLAHTSTFELDSYKCFTKARRKRKGARRNSGGLCIFIRNEFVNLFHVEDWNFEDGFILKSKFPCFPCNKYLFFMFVYLKPSTSSRNELQNDLDDFDTFSEKVSELKTNGEIIIIGDINARTGNLCDIYDSSSLSNNDYSPDFFNSDSYLNPHDLLINNISIARKNKDHKTNDYGHKLINFCKISGLMICNGRVSGDKEGEFTYIDKKGKSAIDYTIVSKGFINCIKTFSVHEPTVFSDHSPIVFSFNNILPFNSIQINETEHCNKQNNKSYRWSNENSCNIFSNNMNDNFAVTHLNCIIDILKDENCNNDVIDNCISVLNTVLEYAAHPLLFTNTMPMNNSSKHTVKNMWYDNECRLKKKEFDTAILVYKEESSNDNLKNLTTIRNSYRKLCRQKNSKYLSTLSSDLLELSKKNPKAFWKKIKRKNKRTLGSCDFDLYFKNLFENNTSNLSQQSSDLINDFLISDEDIHDDFLDQEISLDELNKALKKLNNNKSPGSDLILNEFLKYNTPLFQNALLSVFNYIFKLGYFPKAWSLGLITPIHKKGDLNLAENYRGISLFSCLGKLFTSILNYRLNEWAETNSKFDELQHGFRQNKSTIDAMFLLQTAVDIFLQNKNALYVSFIDLRKAFDKTHHLALWFKLSQNGVSTQIIKLIRNMYSKIKLCVKSTYENYMFTKNVDDPDFNMPFDESLFLQMNEKHDLSDTPNISTDYLFSPAAGVFQGESLSPFLFSMYLNDLQNFMSNEPNIGISIFQFFMILILFADDMVLFSNNRFGLQRGLNKFHEYCEHWGLEVNVDKTKCMVFKNGGKKNKLDRWTFNGQEVETVTEFRYLGFIFSSSGKFKIGLDNLQTRGEKALFDMISSIENFKDMYVNMKLSLFESLVKPVILYGCEIWGFCEAKKLETFYLRFLKHTLYVRKTTPTCFVYRECNVYPLYITRLLRIIKYWLKIVSLDESSPIRSLYNIALDLNEHSNNTTSHWIFEVKNTLYKHGFGYVWLNQQYAADFDFFPIFKARLIDSFWQSNNSSISDLSEHRLYRHLKDNSNFYLTQLPNNHIRKSLTKLRLGSHHFMIERGRWNKLDYVDRICFECNDIEDEYHVVMICKKYNKLRKQYLPQSLYDKPSMFKFINYLNCENVVKLRKLGLFMFHVFKKYEEDEIYA